MRLTRLEISGFGAFRDATTIDFTDTDFFALIGPTGSGKSTVIDAVCFALYGSVPRYENKGLIRYVVTLGASEARVSLMFELEGTGYIATRVIRRSARGQVSTKEARLERVEPDGSTSVLAGAEREMSPAVEGLLHLDFDDFTKCVVLPQGEFARFLRAKGDERRELLIKLLNLDIYTEVGRRAGLRAAEAESGAASPPSTPRGSLLRHGGCPEGGDEAHQGDRQARGSGGHSALADRGQPSRREGAARPRGRVAAVHGAAREDHRAGESTTTR